MPERSPGVALLALLLPVLMAAAWSWPMSKGFFHVFAHSAFLAKRASRAIGWDNLWIYYIGGLRVWIGGYLEEIFFLGGAGVSKFDEIVCVVCDPFFFGFMMDRMGVV